MTRDEGRLLEEKYGGVENVGFETDCERLAKGEPLAYVIGWQPFLGLKIYLDSKPLIPRPETEWWTEKLLGEAANPRVNFLDLCSGSGAIGCAALARLPNAQVYFGEIDTTHKATILKNIRENNLDITRADIYIGDLFDSIPSNIFFDIIATNPPYIPENRTLPHSVTNFEPSLALYAGTDGLDFIRRITSSAGFHLAKNGVLWCECDSEHAASAKKLFDEYGFNARISDDQYGVPRVIVVSSV